MARAQVRKNFINYFSIVDKERHEQKKGDGSRRRVRRLDHGAANRGYGFGRRRLDRHFGRPASWQSAGYNGIHADYADGFTRDWNYNGHPRLSSHIRQP